MLASAPAIEGNARAQERDIEADARFVAALAPMLDQGARERAMAVRVRAGDPAAQLFG